MTIPTNIESRRQPGRDYLIGYRGSDGRALRIYGKFGHYWCAYGTRRTLAEISKLLRDN